MKKIIEEFQSEGMNDLDIKELQNVACKHRLWLHGAKDGERANLRYADLRYANLERANLERADLESADLRYADLRYADLSVTKYDLWAVLLQAQAEIPGLVQFLKDGRIDGSAYDGECACLVGTIAKIKGVAPHTLPDIKTDANRPVERWFLAIREGDTPENNAVSKITIEWIGEFQKELSHSDLENVAE